MMVTVLNAAMPLRTGWERLIVIAQSAKQKLTGADGTS